MVDGINSRDEGEDERDGRLKLIMRLKKDEGAQSHRAEDSL